MKRAFPILGSLLATLLLLAPASLPAAREYTLTVLFTNDHHGQLLPLKDSGRGGVSRRRTLIQQIRNEVGSNRVVLVDAGDLFMGTPLSGLTSGEADSAAYQLMGYDAIALGNHDFDYGKEALKKLRIKFRTPWVSSNTVDRGTSQNFMRAYVLKSCGLRVGIIGFSNMDTPHLTGKGNTRGLTFNPPSAVAKGLHSILKKDADVFIALSHLGLEEDKKLASLDPYLHVIVGGHDHQVLEEPVVTLKKDGTPAGPIICQTGSQGLSLGRLDLTLQGSVKAGYRVVRYDYRLIPVEADVTPDPAMEELLRKYADKVDLVQMEEVVGRASSDIPRVNDQDGAWGQLTIDAIRKAAQADAAFLNSGTFRADLKEGPLTRADVYALIPFDDEWVVRDMAGSVLKQALARSYEKRGTGAFLQVSGLKVKEEEGSLVVTVNGEPLESRRQYRVAMNDFLSDGGDGYGMFPRLKGPKERGASVRNLLLDVLKDKGSLSSGDVEKRWDLKR